MEWSCRAHPVPVRDSAQPPTVGLVGGWLCDVSERPAGWAGPEEWANEAIIYTGPWRTMGRAGWPVHDGGRSARPALVDE